MEGESETIVRYARLAAWQRPVPIYPAETLEPIDPDWAALTRTPVAIEGRSGLLEGFCMYFLTLNGRKLSHLQFDTLEIALDQANAIASIPLTAWRECHVVLPEDQDDDRIPWSLVRQISR